MAEGEGNGVEAGGGGGGGGEKKVMKFSFSKAKPSNRKPPLPVKRKEKDEEDEEEVRVEYVTSVDAEAGIVVVNPRAGRGVKVVPKLENSWRPEKRMKNIMMEGDVMKATEETFEMETMGAGPKPDVQYGLTVMERVVEVDGVVEPPVARMSLKEIEDQKLREDLANLPEEATLDQYEELPVEEFGEALLRGMGWEKGKPIGRNSKVVVAPVEYTRRQGSLGLGATPPPPKETNKKYIKPGEVREKRREEYLKPRLTSERRSDEESRDNGRDEYVKSRDSREYHRDDDARGNRRGDYIEPRDSLESRREEESRGSRREDYTESRNSRDKRKEEHRRPKDSRDSRREERYESRDSRERREDYSRRDEYRESRQEEKRSDRR